MLFSPIGEGAPLRIQGCYLSDEEIEKVVEHCRAQGRARYDEEVLSYGDDGGAGVSPADGVWIDASLAGGGQAARRARDEHDEFFDEALELVRQTGRASTSYLQRRLKIGYNRAARVMDELEAAGFVSAPDSRGDRKVL
jgi:DNA segregation ATPase FtsK/SpoIIIE, S-DNA-T family